MRRITTLLLLSLLSLTTTGTGAESTTPTNIILFIGDGLGVSHLTAGKLEAGTLHMERFKTVGFTTTHAHDAFVTDSAAAGTALATGRKTYTGALSVSPDKQPLKTVVEWAKEKGKAAGLVTTSSITHATPAAFIAHVHSRKLQPQIAEHIAASDIDVLMGGGFGYFIPSSVKGSLRKDDKDVLATLSAKMTVTRNAEDIMKIPPTTRRYAALISNKALKGATQRALPLAVMTRKAIDILDRNPNGFFLMVEGAQIDWAAHDNETRKLIDETIDFDHAVGTGLDFAISNKHTLVIVASDHETGGFALHDGSIKNQQLTQSAFTTKQHTGTMVPVFAFGPGCNHFAGIQDNTDLGKHLIRLVGGTP